MEAALPIPAPSSTPPAGTSDPIVEPGPQPLSRLAPGQNALVRSVDTSCAIGRRLLDLGFRPGTPLKVVRRAPFGDPTLFEVRGSRFCLRRGEANRIVVVLHPDA